MNCPNCNKDIPNELDQFDKVRVLDANEDRRSLDVEYGVICPQCGKEFQWTNTWRLSFITIYSPDTHKSMVFKFKERE